MTLALTIDTLIARGLSIAQMHPDLVTDEWDWIDRGQALRGAFVSLKEHEKLLDLRHFRALACLTSPAANMKQVLLFQRFPNIMYFYTSGTYPPLLLSHRGGGV
jgi:hypothetical protein